MSGVIKLLRTIAESGSSARKARPKTGRTPEIVAAVEEMIMSQESQPGTHRSTRQIAREIEVSQTTVSRIIP